MYYDLTDSKTFDSVRDALETSYWINKDVLEFAFDIYWRNEETLENICYYCGLDIEDVLKEAWIEEEEEEDEEEDE